jgi:hypothetical protein
MFGLILVSHAGDDVPFLRRKEDAMRRSKAAEKVARLAGRLRRAGEEETALFLFHTAGLLDIGSPLPLPADRLAAGEGERLLSYCDARDAAIAVDRGLRLLA